MYPKVRHPDHQRSEQSANQPEKHALQQERPANEVVGSAHEPQHFDLPSPRVDRQPDSAPNHKQGNQGQAGSERKAEEAYNLHDPNDIVEHVFRNCHFFHNWIDRKQTCERQEVG